MKRPGETLAQLAVDIRRTRAVANESAVVHGPQNLHTLRAKNEFLRLRHKAAQIISANN